MFDVILKNIKKLNGKTQILVYLYVFKEGAVKESSLRSQLTLSTKAMKTVCVELVSKNCVTTAIDDKGVMWYFINLSHYDGLLKRCDGCKSIIKQGDFVFCKDKACPFSILFNNKQKVKQMKKVANKYLVVDYTKNNGLKKSVEQWGKKEFVNYIITKYKGKFPGIKLPTTKRFLTQQINEMLIIIKRLVGNKQYPLYCKRHVDYLLNKLKNSESFNVREFTDIKEIKRTLLIKDKKSNKKKLSAETCEVYGIMCDYWKGSCTLVRDEIECTRQTRRLMIRKYDI